MDVKKDNFKYFQNILIQKSKKSNEFVNIKKPTKLRVSKNGLKLFIEINHPKTGLVTKRTQALLQTAPSSARVVFKSASDNSFL